MSPIRTGVLIVPPDSSVTSDGSASVNGRRSHRFTHCGMISIALPPRNLVLNSFDRRRCAGGGRGRGAWLVASDLDGTLLRTDGTVSGRTRDAHDRLTAEGVSFVVVTARSVMLFEPLAEHFGGNGHAICSNGAAVYDLATSSIRQEWTIDAGVGAAVVGRVREVLPEALFAVDFGHDFAREPSWEVRDFMRGREFAVAPAEELVQLPVVKILVRVDSAAPDDLVATLRQALRGLATVTSSTSWGMAEISAADVTKGAGLARHATALGVGAADVVAIGDMPNDRPMLDWAGCAAVVANAHPALLPIADVVTASNDDDGVALLIETLLDDPGRPWPARSAESGPYRLGAGGVSMRT